MAITLTDVKTYLRVDFDVDDGLLNQCMTAAESYLENAISDYQSNLVYLSIAEPKMDKKNCC